MSQTGPDPNRALKAAFDTLLQRLETDESVIDSIRSLALANLAQLMNGDEWIDRIQAVAEAKGYQYALANSYCLRFYYHYVIDLDKAIQDNDTGLAIIRQLPDYRERPAYLSLLNNAVLANTLRLEYLEAYRYATEALSLCDPDHNVTTYCALLNNTAIILSDIGLHKKALRQMECSMECLPFQSVYNAATTRYRYGDTLVQLGRLDEAEAQLRLVVEQHGDIFPWQIYPDLIRIAYLRKDGAAIDEWREKMLAADPFSGADSFDLRNVYYSLGLAHLFHREFEQAEEKLLQVLDAGGIALLSQSQLLRAIIELYETWQRPEKALPYYRDLAEMDRRAMMLADNVLAFELEGGQNSFQHAQESLFRHIHQVAKLGQRLTDCLSYPAVYSCLAGELGQVCPFDAMALAVLDPAAGGLIPVRTKGDRNPWNAYSAVRHCVRSGTLLDLQDVSGEVDALPPFVEGQVPPSGSVLLAPILYQGDVVGMLALYHHEAAFYRRNHQEALNTLSASLGITLHIISQYQSAVGASLTDALTGILNRSGLYHHEAELRAQLPEDSFAVLLMDVDDFKTINDAFGHSVGDQVLRQVASVLRNWAVGGATCRYGGDEFLAMLPLSDRDLLADLETLLSQVRTTVITPAGKHITMSLGASYLRPGQPLSDAIGQADKALYQAKNHGKNRVQINPGQTPRP